MQAASPTAGAKRAVVTGAASGLGRDLCIELARRKFWVLAADIDCTEAAVTVKMVQQAGGTGEAYSCDVTSADEVCKMADYVFSGGRSPDLLVNDAGVAAAGAVGDMPIEDWQWVMGVNFWGVVYGCHAFIPGMKRAGKGHIINVASAAGMASLPEMACYNVSKAAVISLSETLKAELAPHNIGVTVVCPSFFNTDLLKDMRFCDEFQSRFANTAFDNARVTSQEIAGMTVAAYEKNRLYVVPQPSARLQWLFKRFSPARYCESVARFNRLDARQRITMALARLGMT